MTNYEQLREEKMKSQKFKETYQQAQIKTYRAKLIATTNASFSYYCGQSGLLAVPPLGYSPQFRADDLSLHILTLSWLVSVEESQGFLSLQTKNSVYDFELLDD